MTVSTKTLTFLTQSYIYETMCIYITEFVSKTNSLSVYYDYNNNTITIKAMPNL